jgi:hypothetical protein
MNSHIFFCSEMDCSNETLRPDVICMDCWESTLTREQPEGCPGCGVIGATMALNNGYCGSCWQQRFGCESPIFQVEDPVVVRLSDELKAELLANLPAEGDKWSFTAAPPLPPSPEPEHKSLGDYYDEIAKIKDKLLTKMTPRQTADWQWLLERREAEVREHLEDMWAGYDRDDLRKLDLMGRRYG